MEHPTNLQVQLALKRMAEELGDDSLRPFRVELLRIHGSEAPKYTVVVLSTRRALLCEHLGKVVGRSFDLGIRSFLLTLPQALRLMLRYGQADQAQVPGEAAAAANVHRLSRPS